MPRYARRPSGQRRPPGPWKNGPVPVVGLIGGIGAGKSRVASILSDRGAAVLDADAIGHALLDQRPAREQVVARFGQEVLDHSVPEDQPPRIDRSTLGPIVFAEPSARAALETILHPKMRKAFERAIRRIGRRGEAPLVVIDAAILLEAGWDDLCDTIVFVDAPETVRQDRLAHARGWSVEQLALRESAQWPLDRKRSRADFLIRNESTLEELASQVEALWDRLIRRPPRSARPDPAEPRDGGRLDRRARSEHARHPRAKGKSAPRSRNRPSS